jgi:hypothetical protein
VMPSRAASAMRHSPPYSRTRRYMALAVPVSALYAPSAFTLAT